MFNWFRHLRRAGRAHRPKAPPCARLNVEALEERYNPTAPSIYNLSATRIGDYLVVQGSVLDESPSLATVALSGAASAQVSVNGNGNFSYYQAYNSGTQVSAQATDIESLISGAVSASITQPLNANPFVTASVTYGAQRSITITGRVIDESPGGLTVSFGGAANGSTTTDSNGNFSITMTADRLGMVSVTTLDSSLHLSNTATVQLTSVVPDIQNFSCSYDQDGWYVFSGQVLDESAGGLTVYFGGTPMSLLGKQVTVDADGWFHLSVHLNGTLSDDGTAMAMVTDWWGLADSATCDVHQA